MKVQDKVVQKLQAKLKEVMIEASETGDFQLRLEVIDYQNLICKWLETGKEPSQFVAYCQEKIKSERLMGFSVNPYQSAVEWVKELAK